MPCPPARRRLYVRCFFDFDAGLAVLALDDGDVVVVDAAAEAEAGSHGSGCLLYMGHGGMQIYRAGGGGSRGARAGAVGGAVVQAAVYVVSGLKERGKERCGETDRQHPRTKGTNMEPNEEGTMKPPTIATSSAPAAMVYHRW